MKYKTSNLKTINLSINDLVEIFIQNKIIANINLFGVKYFNINELSKNNFNKIGDDDYFLFEKNFRIINSLSEVNLKIYYYDRVHENNGMDFGEVRFLSLIKKISPSKARLYKKIEIFIDDYFNMYLLINNGILFWIGRDNKKFRNNFKLLSISSNIGHSDEINYESVIKSIKSSATKITHANFLCTKYKNNMQIKSIINTIFEKFPNALED